MPARYLEDVFGEGGVLARTLPAYRPRAGQLALADLVDRAIADGCCVLGEGPTGTGKTLAYGVPAVYHAVEHDKRIVIATANIALQEQLVLEDLPFLRRVLPWPFRYELVKGRNNYVCKHRTHRGQVQLFQELSDRAQNQLRRVLEWSSTTESGDGAELPFVPESSVWSRVSVTGDECTGSRCRQYSECHYERVKQRVAGADVLVTNYHLLFAHLALMDAFGVSLLPPFDALILDEAHEAADIARTFFGFSMTARTTERLASDIANTGAEAVAGQVHTLGAGFFGELAAYARSSEYRSRLETAGFVDAAPLVDTLRIVAHRMETRSHDSDLSDDDQAVAENIARRAETLGGQIEEAVALADENKAYWIEVSEKGNARLKAGFIEVAPLLSRTLFARCRSIALVSATLATAKSFGFVRRELGVPGMPLELVAPTPFDFARQSLLVVPTGLPEPRNAAYLDAVVHHVQAVVDLCGGRTLGLFTSYRALDYVHARLDCSGRTLLRQGDAPRHVLIRRFRDDVTSVLLGTASFWTGVDVPGESLTALVIDKLPFPRPDEPLIDAICARDPRAFDNYLLPRTIMTLRQGLGRLIRTETDIGVAVVLDRRILGDTYARRIRQSLPPMRRTRDLAEIAAFLKPLPASGPRDRAE